MAKSEEKEVVKSAPVMRTSAGLRDAIFDEIDAIRNGTSNPTRANAVAKLTSGIVETVQMELDVQKHLRQHRGSLDPVNLGDPLALSAA